MAGTRPRRCAPAGGAESEAMAVVRGAEEHNIGLSVLQETFGGGVRFQISWGGRVLTASYDCWPMVVGNLMKTRK